jgi:hypothetical protein
MIKKLLQRAAASLPFLFLLFGGTPLHAQDIFKRTATPFVQFGGPGQPVVPWGPGAGAFNNNFWFNMLFPEQGVCVWVTNNNPISAHSFSLVVSSTANPSVPGFTGFTGQWVTTTDALGTTFPFSLAANTTKSFFFAARSSAYVNLGFSGSAALGGVPDTATIEAVETNSANCSAVVIGNTVIGPTPAGSAISVSNNNPLVIGGKQNSGGAETSTAMFADIDSATHGLLIGTLTSWNEALTTFGLSQMNAGSGGGPPLGQMVLPVGSQSDVAPGAGSGDTFAMFRASHAYGLATSSIFAWAATQEANNSQQPMMSFQAQKDAVNPAGGALLLSVNVNNATNQGFTPFRITVSCSAACDYTINRVSDAGNTCSSVTVTKVFDPTLTGATLYVGASTGTCVANPTITATYYHFWLAAGGTQVTDMTGYYTKRQGATGNGFDVQMGGALTGTASSTIEFFQHGNN